MTQKLLSVEHLTITGGGALESASLVDDISFSIGAGEPVAIVGESGSGKSLTALAIMGLLPNPPLKVSQGSIVFEGRSLLDLPASQMRSIRGRRLAMIFQEPATSLNPVYTTGEQIMEVLRLHEGLSRSKARERAAELFDLVGIPSARMRLDDYPHQMSGGMRQRVMIAMALACNPTLLIADEPTTALDATIQTQIMDLLSRLQVEIGLSVLLISHDLGLVADFASRVIVMYAGRLVEEGPADAVLGAPGHPYSQGLVDCVHGLESDSERLQTIEGQVPPPGAFPPGCRFATRCSLVQPLCSTTRPPTFTIAQQQRSACFRHIDFDETRIPAT